MRPVCLSSGPRRQVKQAVQVLRKAGVCYRDVRAYNSVLGDNGSGRMVDLQHASSLGASCIRQRLGRLAWGEKL